MIWFAWAQRNRKRELGEQFAIARHAAHGDEKAIKALFKDLDLEVK